MAIFTCDGVTKKFGGLKAVDNVSLEIEEGSISGLIGPNGAGKTTLFNVITGVYPGDKGSVHFKDKDITGLSPRDINQTGIARTWQIPRPFKNMTVYENVRAGALFGLTEEDPDERTEWTLDLLNLQDVKERNAAQVTIGDKKLMELARAVATEPSLILVDELVAGLNPTETKEAIGGVKKLREAGITIFEIEHDMEAIMDLSDKIIVLHEGGKISEGTPDEIRGDDNVVEAYLGEEYARSK